MTEENQPKGWSKLEELQEFYRGERELHPGSDYRSLLDDYIDALEDDWPVESEGGSVLQRDKIREYAEDYYLIHPFNDSQLKTASYRLTVGDTYQIEGNVKRLPRDAKIVIDPFNVVVIRTYEVINMPRSLIGRWNIKVSKAYEGLLWVGGPQVDPGYAGHLFCPIYNLSSSKKELHFREELAVLDFITTTDFPSEEKANHNPAGINPDHDMEKPKPEGLDIRDYGPMESALKSEAARLIEENQDDIESLRRRTSTIQGATLAIIAILFASLGIIASAAGTPQGTPLNLSGITQIFSVILSALALLVAGFVALYVLYKQ